MLALEDTLTELNVLPRRPIKFGDGVATVVINEKIEKINKKKTLLRENVIVTEIMDTFKYLENYMFQGTLNHS